MTEQKPLGGALARRQDGDAAVETGEESPVLAAFEPVTTPHPYSKKRWYSRISGVWALFLAVVVVPFLAGLLYFGVIASDRYVSHAALTIRTAGAQAGGADLLGAFLGASVGGGSAMDGSLVQAYIGSREMVTRLQGWLDLREIYATEDADWVSRLTSGATDEELITYLQDRIRALHDPATGVITLEVEAFNPSDAQAVALAIVALSDELVDSVAARAREDGVRFAASEVAAAEERLAEIRANLRAFRNQHGELDPAQAAGAVGGLVATLEGQLAEARTELGTLRSYMREDAAQVVGIKARVAALEAQLAAERKRLGNPDGGQTYSDLLSEYERLVGMETFATNAYAAAVAAQEQARAEAARKHVYLVPFVAPSMPDEATKPRRVLSIFVVLAGGLIAFGILSLIIAAIREHARL